MNTRIFFTRLAAWTAVSILHVFVALFIYPIANILVYIGMVFVLVNMGMLLWYFTQSIQLVLAYRLSKKTTKDPYVWFSGAIGILLNPLLIYLFFVILFGYIAKLANL